MPAEKVIIFETFNFTSAYVGWFKLETNECETHIKIMKSAPDYQVHYFIFAFHYKSRKSFQSRQTLKCYRWLKNLSMKLN